MREYAQRLDEAERRLRNVLSAAVGLRQQRVQRLELRLTACHPRTRIEQMRSLCARIADRSETAIRRRTERAGNRLRIAARALQSLSPLATLDRGYAIVMDASGTILRQATQTRTGERLGIRLAQGSVQAEVTDVEPAPPAGGSGEELGD